MTDVNGADTAWIRSTSPGLLPYESGSSGHGHCSIGSPYWYFGDGYFDRINGGTPITSNGGTINGMISTSSSSGSIPTNIIFVPNLNWSVLVPSPETVEYFKQYLIYICAHYPNKIETIFFGGVRPNSAGIAAVYIYDTSNVSSEGLPEYSTGIYLTLGSGLNYFRTYNYNYSFT